MQITQQLPAKPSPEPQDRPDPSHFVMSIAVALFVLTIGAVITMHLATQNGWQVL